MPLPLAALGAGKLAGKGIGRIRRRVKGAKTGVGRAGRAATGLAPPRRRQKRIVFSENQWRFVSSLISSITGRRLPTGMGRRTRRRRSPF